MRKTEEILLRITNLKDSLAIAEAVNTKGESWVSKEYVAMIKRKIVELQQEYLAELEHEIGE